MPSKIKQLIKNLLNLSDNVQKEAFTAPNENDTKERKQQAHTQLHRGQQKQQ